MRKLRLIAFSGVVSGVVACGGGAAPPPAAKVPAAPPPIQVVAQPAPTPVAAPPSLFAVARLASAARVIDTGVAWSGLPLDARAMLEKEVPGFQQVASLEAPIDFAAMLDPTSGEVPRVEWAFAFGVSSTEGAAEFFRKNGLRVIRGAGGDYVVSAGKELSCVVTAALGATPARAVCSEKQKDAEALAPYMSRGLSTADLGTSELHAHVLAEPFRRKYGAQLVLLRTVGVPFLLRELSMDDPKLDAALRESAYALADELTAIATEVDRLDVDLALTPARDAVDLKAAFAFAGERSWLSHTLSMVAGKAAPPPDLFWRLPAESVSASYTAHREAEVGRPLVAHLRALLDGLLAHLKLPDARRVALVDACEQLFLTEARSVAATMPTAPSSGGAEGRDGDAELRAIIDGVVGGVHVFAVDSAGDRVQRAASELVRTLGDRTFRANVAKLAKVTPDALPTARERAPKAKGLPAGSRVYEWSIDFAALSDAGKAEGGRKALAPKKKPAKTGKPVTLLLVAAPDGAVTWFGFGLDEATLASRLVAVRDGKSPTLATRPGVAGLRQIPALSGGFSSLAAFLEGRAGKLGAIGAPEVLARLPHRAETELVWTGSAEAQGPRMSLSWRLRRELVEDIVALASQAGHR